jgi:hypothetical protein
VKPRWRGHFKLGYPIAKVIERWFEPIEDSNADIYQALRTDLLAVPRERATSTSAPSTRSVRISTGVR